ncbi:MAG: DUF4383 domain-containing protein [Gemmatimonadales bacterium]
MKQTVAKVFGVVLVLVGLLGFFLPSSFGMATTMLAGSFEVNLVHNLVHVLIGIWGLVASRTATGATAFCKQAGVLFLLLAILGFVPSMVALLANLVPIGGNDVYLHLVFAAILLYVGFSRARTPAAG